MQTISNLTSTALRAAVKAPPTKDTSAVIPLPSLASVLLARFETFAEPCLESARFETLQFCADLQARFTPRWLSILGRSGNGKTFLAQLISQFVREKGGWYRFKGPAGDVVSLHRVMWVNWRSACAEMKQGDFSRLEELCLRYRKVEEQDHAAWFAVIDDIGSADETEKSYLLGALDRLADCRLGQWTVFTSNLTLDQIGARLDPRIASRMLRGGNRVVEVNAEDYNLRKR